VEHKTSPMRNAIEHIFFPTESVEKESCSVCKQPVTEFKNAVSSREYEISGMCQSCQDDVFEGYDEDV